MESLKEKILKLKKDVENSTLRAELFEQKLSVEKDRLEKAEEKTTSLSRKIQSTQIELKKVNNDIQVKEEEIANKQLACEVNEGVCDVFIEGEVKNMEEELDLERQIKDLNDFTNIVQMEYEASLKKITSMTNEKKQLHQDEEHLNAQESALQEKLKDLSEKLRNSKNEQLRNKKQGDPEKRCCLLKQKVQEAELRLENAERTAQQLERTLSTLGDELQEITSSKQETDVELQGLLSIAHEN